MKKSIIILAMFASSSALAMPASEFFARDKEKNWDRPLAYQTDLSRSYDPRHGTANRASISKNANVASFRW